MLNLQKCHQGRGASRSLFCHGRVRYFDFRGSTCGPPGGTHVNHIIACRVLMTHHGAVPRWRPAHWPLDRLAAAPSPLPRQPASSQDFNTLSNATSPSNALPAGWYSDRGRHRRRGRRPLRRQHRIEQRRWRLQLRRRFRDRPRAWKHRQRHCHARSTTAPVHEQHRRGHRLADHLLRGRDVAPRHRDCGRG